MSGLVRMVDAHTSGRGYGWRMPGRHRMYRADVALAVVLALYGQFEAWTAPAADTAIAGPAAVNAAAFLVASAALLWRRGGPGAVRLVGGAHPGWPPGP